VSPSSRRRAQKPAARPEPRREPADARLAPDGAAQNDPADDGRGGIGEEIGGPAPADGAFALALNGGGRLAIGAGIAYALFGFIGSSLLPVGTVAPEDQAPTIARRLVAERGRISAGILLTLFSLLFLLVFVSWLYSWLRRVEGGTGWLATTSLVGGILLVAMLSVVVLLSIATTVLGSYGSDPVIARTLLVLQWQAVAVAFVPAAALVGAVSLVGYRAAILPRWICFSGMAIAIGLLIPPLAFLPFLLSSLWTGLLAVVLLQRTRLVLG
jgi:hypothetical protein